ncbi:MAG: ferritin-like domain-containing protein [Simkaniaceae bacterium]
MRTDSMNHLFVDLLKDIYSSENQVVQLLPEVLNAVQSNELKNLINKHIQNTKTQIERLKKALGSLNENLEGKKCLALEGFANEFHEYLKEGNPSAVKDAGIIALLQRIQHYEISSYGTLRTYANLLGYKEMAKLFNESITEEGTFDKKLTSIAEGGIFSSGINKAAKKAA